MHLEYLFDYPGGHVPLSGQRDKNPEEKTKQADAGTWDKVRHTASAIAEGLTMLPGGFVDTVRDAWRCGDIAVTDDEARRKSEGGRKHRAAGAGAAGRSVRAAVSRETCNRLRQ